MEQKAIEQAIQSVRDFYEQQGIFMKPFGFGAKPTLLIIYTTYPAPRNDEEPMHATDKA